MTTDYRIKFVCWAGALPIMQISLFLVVGIVLLSANAYSQGTASIVGTVTDPSGGVIPGAKVTITSVETGLIRSTSTNTAGAYAARELSIGHYNVRVEATGFKAYEQTGLTLSVNDTVRADVALQVGGLTELVTVEANALQIQSNTNEISQTITDTQVAQLSTNGRNVLQLAALVPGAAASIPDFDTPMAQTQNRAIQYNGQRSDHNNWIVNGGEAYDRGGGGILLVSPSQDALQEFKVMTSNFAADLGQSSGGMVTMATKSGTSKYHGGAWEYVRNDALDANPWANNFYNRAKPELRYNMFGFNVGGPVPIGKEKKTFFFYNMEWRRLIKGSLLNAVAAPKAWKSGDFSAYLPTANGGTCSGSTNCIAIMVPATSDPNLLAKYAAAGVTPSTATTKSYFPNNKIPSGLLSANAQAVLGAGLFPDPNAGDRYVANNNQTVMYREETFRLDHQLTSKLALMGSLIYDNAAETDYPPLWAGGTFNTAGSVMAVPSWAGVVHATYTISPTLLNEAAFNLNGNDLNITNEGTWKAPSGYSIKTLFNPAANTDGKLPAINIGSPISMGYTPGWWPWYNTWRSWQWKDDISWTHGKHNMKFGASYMFTHKWQEIQDNSAGTVNFGTVTGNSFADFMLGLASSYSEPSNVDFVNISNNTFSIYGMDDWRVTNRLTLNLGLRWEGLPHSYDSKGRASNFYPNLYDPKQAATFIGTNLDPNGPGFQNVSGIPGGYSRFYMNGVGLAGKNGIPSGLVQNSWNTFAPRVGFAFDLTGKGKTVLRAGAGIFYERLAGNEQYNMGKNAPFYFQGQPTTVYWDNPATNYQTGVTAALPFTPTTMTTVAYDYKIPTAIQWSLGIQHQLRQNLVLTVSYVGNENYHQSDGRNINMAMADDATRLKICGTTCGYSGTRPDANRYRPYQGWSSIAPMEFGANSNYNSLQATFRATAFKGMNINSSYTWSHAFDIIDGEIFSNVSNPFNVKWDYGQAGFDRTHIFVTSFVYDLPFFKNATGAAHKILGGWVYSGIANFQSGTPFSIGGGNDNLGYGGGTSNRANVVAPVTYPKTREQWFSKSSFKVPDPLQWGNMQRNMLRGPGRNNWNMSIFKEFHFTESAKFELRVETFNTFNHTQWTNPGTNILTSSSFGIITGTYGPRNLEIGLKLNF